MIVGHYVREALSLLPPKKSTSEGVGPLRNKRFSDDTINRVLSELERKHRFHGSPLLPPRELYESLDVLFDRKTFRRESLLNCTLQNWTARLHAAYQTLEILKVYQGTVRDLGSPEEYRLYRQLLTAVDHYCMIMATYLFEKAVDESEVKNHIGKPEFSSHLPKERKFREEGGMLQDMNPSWDESRKEACKLMDTLISPVA